MSGFALGGRGDKFMADAEARLKKFSFFGNGTKFEDASELYQKAGNCYKLESTHEASAALMDAGNCYKKSSPPSAISAFRAAVSNWCEAGRFNQAAKLTKEIAEMYEKDNEVVEAIDNYSQAATFFDTENSKSQGNTCKAKVAELCSAVLEPPDFARAADIYETLGRNCLDSALIKYNAKNYFTSAVFCQLAMGDAVAARMKIEHFGGMDFSFRDSREGKLCDALCQSFDDYDPSAMATACMEFDRVSKLDAWKTQILVRSTFPNPPAHVKYPSISSSLCSSLRFSQMLTTFEGKNLLLWLKIALPPGFSTRFTSDITSTGRLR
ncbi:hypothetical protein TrRE_jg10939 [Triparma retinervis]|uniref:Alpha-soluble NSF attachment protein n=1 Tax=Triparma retinervis TaxID=2557542 RepID=A0A9W6Z1X3_9STRA|nr:hypothetical protein TrRE_jg10939 [Triparma retinervis]